jgi:hypothetical protein
MRYLPQLPLGFLPLLPVLSVRRFLPVVPVRFLPLGGFLPIMPIGPVRLRERVGKLRRQRVRLLAAMPRQRQFHAVLQRRRAVLVQRRDEFRRIMARSPWQGSRGLTIESTYFNQAFHATTPR